MSIFQLARRTWSIPLGRLFGVPVLGHLSFFAMLALFLLAFGWELVLLGVLSILAHEFGHVLVAKKYGIGTEYVMFLPIGALAALKENPEEETLDEFWMAAAGPMMNLVLAVVFNVVRYFSPAPFDDIFLSMSAFNLLVGLFNLVPAFPLDGGRMLRSFLSIKHGYFDATRYASNVSVVLATIGAGVFLYLGNWVSVVIALVIIWYARREVSPMSLKGLTARLTGFLSTEPQADEKGESFSPSPQEPEE